MAVKARDLPVTMISSETGQILTRRVRPFTVEYRGERLTVDCMGYWPDDPDDPDGVLVGDDMAPADEALRILKQRVHGQAVREARRKLKLTQREAGRLLKVGEKAFDKYERGLVEPSGPTMQLLKLLERHPELLDELR